MVAQLLTWPIYEYSIWTNILHQIFPSGFKGKNKTLWFGRANGSTIADMADLQIFYMDQYLTSNLSIRF